MATTTVTTDTAQRIEDIGKRLGEREPEIESHGWLDYVVKRRFKRSLAKARAKREAGVYGTDVPHDDRAESVVRWACAKTAVTGLLSGLASSAAGLVTADTGVGGIVAIPVGAFAIGFEMVTRTVFHVDLVFELAEVHRLPVLQAAKAHDAVRILSLAMGAAEQGADDELGERKLEATTEERKKELAKRAANLVLGESILRNIVPIFGIISSPITNVIVTYRLGDRVRKAFRFERGMLDALRDATEVCGSSIDLLIEGVWFVFTADGMLATEETAALTFRLDTLSPERRRDLISRFKSDPRDWLERLSSVPENARDTFLQVLHTAASLSGDVNPLEEQLVRRVAEVFGRTYDVTRFATEHAGASAQEEQHA